MTLGRERYVEKGKTKEENQQTKIMVLSKIIEFNSNENNSADAGAPPAPD